MHILLDECVPKRLGRALPGHVVSHVTREGWAGKKNGELMALMMSRGFEVLLTVDQGIPHQQNLATSGVAVMLLIGAGTRVLDLLPLIPEVLAKLDSIQPGEVCEIRA